MANLVNYDMLKRWAKKDKRPVTELIALSPKNDPFYMGTEGDKVNGQWFHDLWLKFGYRAGVHLRRVHYQIVSQDPPVMMPNGKPYENTELCWDYLGQASKVARYLGFVDPEAFIDRRNHDPIINTTEEEEEPNPYFYVNTYTWDGQTRLASFPRLPEYTLANYFSPQKYHLEVWAEKTTMDDVLQPICREYKANLVRGVGEFSITAALDLVKRVERSGKPARIFYISDFDPAGKSMPVAVARKTEYFVRGLGLDLDVRLFPLVLTEAQVSEYQLPRTPIKESELRKDAFEKRFGLGATELDALEALRPGELRDILTEALDEYFDHNLQDEVYSQTSDIETHLRRLRLEAIEPYQSEIEALQEEYRAIEQELAAKLEAHVTRRQAVFDQIEADMNNNLPEWLLDQYPLPEPNESPEYREALYNSERSYIEQIEAYKNFQGKFEEVS